MITIKKSIFATRALLQLALAAPAQKTAEPNNR